MKASIIASLIAGVVAGVIAGVLLSRKTYTARDERRGYLWSLMKNLSKEWRMKLFRLGDGDVMVCEQINEMGVVSLHLWNGERYPDRDYYNDQIGSLADSLDCGDLLWPEWRDPSIQRHSQSDDVAYHAVFLWRLKMFDGNMIAKTVQVMKGDDDRARMLATVQAVGQAAECHRKRMGEWPNRCILRVGMVHPDGVPLMDGERQVCVVTFEEVSSNFPRGVVGVYQAK